MISISLGVYLPLPRAISSTSLFPIDIIVLF
uniref:Uncharacterized protein n=1 Tax=Siphoviridae sp. ctet217 TaxID=2826409 RepID=A0A8S5MEY4_9CAUD|nr:MAG TPA: hypothetical protein [Siphoviridae sp. ctet217]DAK49816.1 MAG TPA: hypothetical protein [Caudoviricetes sp.]DAX25315.1 MAG TPA: hypothetical protein [Caudoviricetes sp.]